MASIDLRIGTYKSGKIMGCPRKKSFTKSKNYDAEASSASHKKIRLSTEESVEEYMEKHFRSIDFLLVFSTISTLVKCFTCDESACKEPRYALSSERLKGELKQSHYKVNHHFAFSMRVLGLGLAGCDKFCDLMNLTSNFPSKTSYTTYIQKIYMPVNNVAKRYFSSAVKEEIEATCKPSKVEDTNELTVSGDGIWERRRFSSLFGVSSSIGCIKKKVFDVFVKSSYGHECVPGNMEVNVIIHMFKRS